MDIYSFINSKDVAEHCRSINHQFNAMESAFIVYRNYTCTLHERHNAFREIIKAMPDMEIGERCNCPHYPRLYGFLRKYMELENKIVDAFKSDTDNAIYNIAVWYKDDDECYESVIPYSRLQ